MGVGSLSGKLLKNKKTSDANTCIEDELTCKLLLLDFILKQHKLRSDKTNLQYHLSNNTKCIMST